MDDPGWGGYVPRPDAEAQAPAEPSAATSPPREAAPRSPLAPSGQTGRLGGPRLPWVIGGAALFLAVLVIGLVVALTGRSSGPTSVASPPVVPTTAASTPTTHALLSKAEFIAKADSICLAYRAQIEQFGSKSDYASTAKAAQAELDELRALGDPAQDAPIIRSMINYGTQAVNYLMIGDPTSANTAIVQADTAAGQFGLRVCNYGH